MDREHLGSSEETNKQQERIAPHVAIALLELVAALISYSSSPNLQNEISWPCLQIEFHLDVGISTPIEAVSILQRLHSAGLRVFSTE